MQRSRLRIALATALFTATGCVFGGGSGTGNSSVHSAPPPLTREAPEEPPVAIEADAPAPFARPAANTAELALAPHAEAPVEADAHLALAEPEKEFEGEGLGFERGADKLAVWVPKDEALHFDVLVDLPVFGNVTAGQVVLSAHVEPYMPGLPGATPADGPQKWMGSIESVATGSHLGYTLREVLKSRLLPQDFPRMYYTDVQTGSENRKKELKLGTQDGKYVDNYRNDGHCKGCNNREHYVDSNWLWGKPSHCDGCKRAEHRVWRPAKTREVPAGTLDMLSAVYLARTMVREGHTSETLSMVDELKLWDVQLTQGVRKRIEVPAGKFDCVEVRLKSSVPVGEPPPKDGFEGLFGLKGTIQVWLDAKTGVPVQIQGEFPIKLLASKLDVYVQLKSFQGAPAGFAPVR
ncbi:MAG: DUF3108 domain-containing protein [Planctomycetes bacterium]|nr:DUF3108 domain-containing protein [Planctomycetota bacterium]